MAQTVEDLEAQKEALEEEARLAEEEAAAKAEEEAKAKSEEEGNSLSEEDIQRIVEKARQQEKDKLYPQITELKSTINTLQEHFRAEQEEKEEIKKKAEADAEAERVAKLSDQERSNEILSRLEEQLKSEREERTRFKAELDARDNAQRLETYRSSAIANAGDELITELVVGNSEAEIDAAVEKAKQKYAEIVGTAKERRAQEVRDRMSSTSPNSEALEEEELKNQGLTNIDEDRYLADKEYRKDIQSRLATAVNRASGR